MSGSGSLSAGAGAGAAVRPAAAVRPVVGVSLKLYFGHRETIDWCERVADLARAHTAVRDGRLDLFVIPAFTEIADAVRAFDGTRVAVGAQDIHWADRGAFTGEVSGGTLAEIGVRLVEVGHAERRRIFGETEAIVADKVDAALRNGLEPVLCVGEADRGSADAAAVECARQLRSALTVAERAGHAGDVLIAYEPQWAIGAAEPAPVEHVETVCRALRAATAEHPLFGGGEVGGRGGGGGGGGGHGSGGGGNGARVIYGGSAGPGLLTRLAGSVDGLFLGRFAHDPAALGVVLDEAAALIV